MHTYIYMYSYTYEYAPVREFSHKKLAYTNQAISKCMN